MNETKFSEKAVRDSWESEIVHFCVLGTECTRCTRYFVLGVLGTGCTRYFVLGVLGTGCTRCTR